MKKKRLIIFIDTMFEYQKGGCSTVNYELCLALRQIITGDVDIISLVINCSKDDRVEKLEDIASNLNISIVHKNIINNEDHFSNNDCKDILFN